MSVKTLKRLIIGLSALCVAIPIIGYTYISQKINSISVVEDEETDQVLEEVNYKQVDGITNILLIGVDARNLNQSSRSDTMMIVTVDNINKSVKLTSLARDTYVTIPGRKNKEKLTHAYAYGGANLLIRTIEENFELDLDNYAIVNFYSFLDLIDALGGVEVDVKKDVLKELRKYSSESYFKYSDQKEPFIDITEPGVQKLNGYQALSYVRIRKNDSAFMRDQRQREVITSLIKQLIKLPPTQYSKILNTVLPNIKTNMKTSDMLDLGFTVLKMGDLNIKQLEFPLLKYSKGRTTSHSGWVLDFNTDVCIDVLHDFIFNDIDYDETKKYPSNFKYPEIEGEIIGGVKSEEEKELEEELDKGEESKEDNKDKEEDKESNKEDNKEDDKDKEEDKNSNSSSSSKPNNKPNDKEEDKDSNSNSSNGSSSSKPNLSDKDNTSNSGSSNSSSNNNTNNNTSTGSGGTSNNNGSNSNNNSSSNNSGSSSNSNTTNGSSSGSSNTSNNTNNNSSSSNNTLSNNDKEDN